MDEINSREENARKIAEDLISFVNNYGPDMETLGWTSFINNYGQDMETFAKTICEKHWPLQQWIMRLFIFTIDKMADMYLNDRNRATVELARQIREIVDYQCIDMHANDIY